MRRHLLEWAVVGALLGAVGLMMSGCGSNPVPQIPHLPDLVVNNDQTFKASVKYVYGVLKSVAVVLNDASKLEDTAAKASGVDDTVVRKAFVTVAQDLGGVVRDIDAGAIKDWATVKSRVDPVLDDINTLNSLGGKAGPSIWAHVLQTAVNIAIALLNPGAFQGV
jgi:hypothetical protein